MNVKILEIFDMRHKATRTIKDLKKKSTQAAASRNEVFMKAFVRSVL